MTLKQLNIPSLEQLQSMTDEAICQHFAPWLEICKPKHKPLETTKTKKKKSVSLTLGNTDEKKSGLAMLQELAKQSGFGDLNLKKLSE